MKGLSDRLNRNRDRAIKELLANLSLRVSELHDIMEEIIKVVDSDSDKVKALERKYQSARDLLIEIKAKLEINKIEVNTNIGDIDGDVDIEQEVNE